MRGLGHLMLQAGSNFQMPLVFAGLLGCSLSKASPCMPYSPAD